MGKEETFDKLYNKIVEDNTSYMEDARKQAKKENVQNKIVLIVLFILGIALLIGACIFLQDLTKAITGGVLTLVVLIYAKVKHRGGKSKIEKYEMDFKERVVDSLIKSFDENVEFHPTERINRGCI